MGVPAFFRWISTKYPRILMLAQEVDDPDATQPNPNNYEFDNLYLDMNGLIHPCTHPEGEAAPPTEEEMYLAIFNYLDRLFNIIRPRRLIYMAIDGVAPRAKMNQQRSRRFRAALEADEASESESRVRGMLEQRAKDIGVKLPPRKPKPWDSNVITPGTEFMATLSDWIRQYIIIRLNTNPAFKNVRVIFSDAQSPGEGEHKIMQFVRRQRAEPGYDPNTTHVLYGLDADLIMLGLASHEIHFTILREQVLFGKKARENEGFKTDSVLLDNKGYDDKFDDPAVTSSSRVKKKKPFELVKVWILREYLQFEFRQEAFYQPLPFPYDFEKCIDDFVFLCFFVGNDFLPHLPALSIKEGGLELLIDIYLKVLPTVGGYLTNDGVVNLERVDVFVAVLGGLEDEIFKRRAENEQFMKDRRDQRNSVKKAGGHERMLADALMSQKTKRRKLNEATPSVDILEMVPLGQGAASQPAPSKLDNKAAAAALKASLQKKEEAPVVQEPEKEATHEEAAEEEDDEAEAELFADLDIKSRNLKTAEDMQSQVENTVKELERKRNVKEGIQCEVRFGDTGWKDRYYTSKFGKEYKPGSTERRNVVEAYIIGLCWVMEYYYRGCQSWTWFYEYHYAPMASDLVNIDQIKVVFPPSKPFKPIDQLMGVLPSQSAHALPEPCRWYMCSPDSCISDFYPKKFKFDANGKAMRWLWIALLPFIDEKRLLQVTRSLEPEFSANDLERNLTNPDVIFTHIEASGSASMLKAVDAYERKMEIKSQLQQSSSEPEPSEDFTPKTAGDVRSGSCDNGRLVLANETKGVGGYFLPAPDKYKLKLNVDVPPIHPRLPMVIKNKVLCFEFRLPPMREHLSQILPNTRIPPPSLSNRDYSMMESKNPSKRGSVANMLAEQGLVPRNHGRSADAYSNSGVQREWGAQTSWGSMEPRRLVRSGGQNYDRPLREPQRYDRPHDNRRYGENRYNERRYDDRRYDDRRSDDRRYDDRRDAGNSGAPQQQSRSGDYYGDGRSHHADSAYDYRDRPAGPTASRSKLMDDLSAALRRNPGQR